MMHIPAKQKLKKNKKDLVNFLRETGLVEFSKYLHVENLLKIAQEKNKTSQLAQKEIDVF
jgi:hypothetical protein